MDLARFVDSRRPQWARLSALLDRIEAGGLKQLSLEEARELGRLYRQASSDLLTARGRAVSADLVEYLNELVARAYAQTYPGTVARAGEAAAFFTRGFPRLVRREWKVVAVSYLVFFLGLGFGFAAMHRDPQAAEVLMPAEHLHLDPSERVKELAKEPGATGSEQAAFASMLFTHNIEVAFFCFALGLTLGAGTLVLLFYNGVMLGALACAYHLQGHALWFWGWILPHGVVEISAICLASAGGLLLARALLMPGDRTAGAALRIEGKDAVKMVLGTIPLFVVAGLTEGTISQIHAASLPDGVKLAYAGAMGCLLLGYLVFAGRSDEAQSTPRRLISK